MNEYRRRIADNSNYHWSPRVECAGIEHRLRFAAQYDEIRLREGTRELEYLPGYTWGRVMEVLVEAGVLTPVSEATVQQGPWIKIESGFGYYQDRKEGGEDDVDEDHLIENLADVLFPDVAEFVRNDELPDPLQGWVAARKFVSRVLGQFRR